MLESPNGDRPGARTDDRRTARRESTRKEVLAEAWALARERGLAGISLRDLGARVGMRAPSLYSYFDSKAAIYDAMFAEGNAELVARVDDLRLGFRGEELLRRGAEEFASFCVEDPVRYQLLFQRTIPGFEPSRESYAGAVAVLDATSEALEEAGITDPAALDLYTALVAGLVVQQLSNDPGGNRWLLLVPEAVEMFCTHQRRKRR
jgi:AcrR family transcriptional regulator